MQRRRFISVQKADIASTNAIDPIVSNKANSLPAPEFHSLSESDGYQRGFPSSSALSRISFDSESNLAQLHRIEQSIEFARRLVDGSQTDDGVVSQLHYEGIL